VHARAFVIDRERGQLEVFERRFLRKGLRTLFPLKALEVSLETRRTRYNQPRSRGVAQGITWVGTTHIIRIAVEGSSSISFSSELQGPGGEQLARALARDMGCRLEARTDDG
jgi:hypothetical protein